MTGTSALRRRQPMPWLWGGDLGYGASNPCLGGMSVRAARVVSETESRCSDQIDNLCLLLLFTTEDLFVRRRQRLLLFVSDSPLRESETVPLGSRGSGASAQGTENLVFFAQSIFFRTDLVSDFVSCMHILTKVLNRRLRRLAAELPLRRLAGYSRNLAGYMP